MTDQINWRLVKREKPSPYSRAAEILRGKIITDRLTGKEISKTQVIYKYLDNLPELRDIAANMHRTYCSADKSGWKSGNLIQESKINQF